MTSHPVHSSDDLSWHSSYVIHLEYLEQSYILLALHRPDNFQFKTGQHLIIQMKDDQGEFHRFYSIASVPQWKNKVEFCIQLQADQRGTSYLKSLKLGDSIQISRARGTFQVADDTKPIIFVAGGSGIGPIRAFLQDILSQENKKNHLFLVYGCRDGNTIPYKDEFINLSKEQSHRFQVAFFAEASVVPPIHLGKLDQAFDQFPETIEKGADYYLCGPPGMIQAVKKILVAKGISGHQIFTEQP